MSFGIGDKVEVITQVYLGRWIEPLEKGMIVNRHTVGEQELYDVLLEDGKEYTFAPNEIEEVRGKPPVNPVGFVDEH